MLKRVHIALAILIFAVFGVMVWQVIFPHPRSVEYMRARKNRFSISSWCNHATPTLLRRRLKQRGPAAYN
jgi:hypothetical protein